MVVILFLVLSTGGDAVLNCTRNRVWIEQTSRNLQVAG